MIAVKKILLLMQYDIHSTDNYKIVLSEEKIEIRD